MAGSTALPTALSPEIRAKPIATSWRDRRLSKVFVMVLLPFSKGATGRSPGRDAQGVALVEPCSMETN